MAYALDAEGNNGVNATTRIGNLDGFDFGVLLQLDGSQSDAIRFAPCLRRSWRSLKASVKNGLSVRS